MSLGLIRLRQSRIGFALVAMALASGCAGKKLGKIDEVQKLPKDIPKEVQDKFEVKDEAALPAPKPSPAPSPLPATSKKPGKKKKGKAAAAPQPSASPEPAAFVWPSRRPAKDPFWPGEKQTYVISYLGLPAGDFTLEMMPNKVINGRRVYHFRGNAVSTKVFSLFYRLDDSVETFIDYDGLFSHRFHLVLDESKQTRDSLELYDSEKRETYFWNRWNHQVNGFKETKETKEIPAFPQDSMSALYYIRTLPLKDGGVYSFPVVSEGGSWEAIVTVLRREEIDSPMGRVKTIVLLPETKYQGVLKKNGDSFMWVTDDDRRLLVKMEAKVKIGTVIATLKAVEPGTQP